MQFGFRSSRPSVAGGRRWAFRPAREGLEPRALLAQIDLLTIAGTPVPPPPPGTGVPPDALGVQFAGNDVGAGAGFAVSLLGDVNGDGFQDFAVGSPSVSTTTGVPTPGFGAGTVYLVFGSLQVGQTPGQVSDFLLLQNTSAQPGPPLIPARNERVADLNQLGNGNQTSPANGIATFPFDGISIVASQNPNGLLGTSIAAVGDLNRDGLSDILIGAPGANDALGNNNGAGRSYLLYGNTNLPNLSGNITRIDLDNTQANVSLGLNIITFTTTLINARTGTSGAAIGDVITDGIPDIAIGAPGASIAGGAGNGAVYVIDGRVVQDPTTRTIPLQLVGQTGQALGTRGVIITGALSGDQAGFSLAAAGNFDGDQTSAGQPIDDFIIGAPGNNAGTGAAFLLYGSIDFATRVTVNGVAAFSLANSGDPALSSVVAPAAIFVGDAPGDQTGFAVGFGGDFNDDNLGDVQIGSPGFQAGRGRNTLVFGRSASPTPPGRIVGINPLSTLNAQIGFVDFQGAAAGARAGFSAAPVQDVNGDGINEILFGSPGFNSNSGAAYLIPGNAGLTGIVPLQTVMAAPASGTIISYGNPGQNFLGTSVSGLISTPGLTSRTVDSDLIGDFLVGAPLDSPFGRTLVGSAFLLEGAFVPLDTPQPPATITVQIAVETLTPPFVVNATTPADLPIVVFSDATINPPFRPLDINPATVVVNGVPFPTATVGPLDLDNDGVPDPNQDPNGDGIPEAQVTITPRSALGLNTSVTSLTITGRVRAGVPNANQPFTGTAPITVVGPPNNGNTLPPSINRFTSSFAFPPPNAAVPPLGERFVPPVNFLSRLRYKPLPVNAAYFQFLPRNGFGARFRGFFDPGSIPDRNFASSKKKQGYKTSTLAQNVFTRGRFKPGQITGRIFHRVPTIPPTP